MSVNVNVLFQEAYKEHQANHLESAIRTYQQILTIEPDHVQTLHFLGLAQAQFGNTKQAIQCLQKALTIEPNSPSIHNNLGNIYKRNNQILEAINEYEKAIALSSDYAQAYHNLARIYVDQKEYNKALHCYRNALHRRPDFVDAHFDLGLLLLRQQQLEAAQTQFNNVLQLAPDHQQALFYTGVLYLQSNQISEAEKTFKSLLKLNPQDVETLTNLGVLALKQEHPQVAVDFFTQAIALDNNHQEARNNLAATFMHYDRFENALMHYDVLLKNEPHNIEFLYNSGVAQMALGHLNEAISHFEFILDKNPEHFATLNNLAAIFIRLDDKEKAKQYLLRAVHACPEDKSSQHMLHALNNDETNPKTCPEYAQNLFDNYALYYEKHVKNQLHYSLPMHIQNLLNDFNLMPEKTLDLGCGTGLTGEILREKTHELWGVDISKKMLLQAKEKKIYDHLITSELILFFNENQTPFDLIVAADVLPYFGELDKLFLAVKSHCSILGYFLFSTEISEDKPWKLQPSARFSHHPDYIRALCKKYGFTILVEKKVVARTQDNHALDEILYLIVSAHSVGESSKSPQ